MPEKQRTMSGEPRATSGETPEGRVISFVPASMNSMDGSSPEAILDAAVALESAASGIKCSPVEKAMKQRASELLADAIRAEEKANGPRQPFETTVYP